MRRWMVLCLLACVVGRAWAADIRVVDDAGQTVVLAQPAARIVSLGPHLTELVYAAGGGERLVGVIRYSDFPAAARALPVVGDAHAIDFERIVQLRPDLVLVWGSGLNERHKARLRSLGLTVYESEIRQARGIAETLRRFGILIGRPVAAQADAHNLDQKWQALADRYRERAPVRVFWQLWLDPAGGPLMTINRQHLISEAMRSCGGVNVFADLPLLTPSVSWEAAVKADPQLIATSGRAEDAARDFAPWQRFAAKVGAVRQQHFASIDGDLIGRMGPRFVDGAAKLCEAIDRVR
jgi:iron complex transport system substrate-binding protein